MRFLFRLIVCLVTCPALGTEIHLNFGDESEGTTPTNFETALLGGGPSPVWKIVSAEMPSAFQAFGGKSPLLIHGMVLAQTSQDMTDERYPMFIYQGGDFADFSLETRFETVSGITEQMAGLVFRYSNSSNFYVVRVSVLGKNITFYKMINGDLASPVRLPLDITNATWHTLKVECSGNYIDCSVDGQKALPTITDSSQVSSHGKIGFWTKSDSVTYFNDATVNYTPRIPAAQQILDEIVQERPKLMDLQLYTLNSTNTTKVLAGKNPADVGKAGTDSELAAIRGGTVSLGFEHGTVIVIMPIHDRNGEFIAAMRVKLKSFFGETQDNAVTRAGMIQKDIEQSTTSSENLLR